MSKIYLLCVERVLDYVDVVPLFEFCVQKKTIIGCMLSELTRATSTIHLEVKIPPWIHRMTCDVVWYDLVLATCGRLCAPANGHPRQTAYEHDPKTLIVTCALFYFLTWWVYTTQNYGFEIHKYRFQPTILGYVKWICTDILLLSPNKLRKVTKILGHDVKNR